MPDIIRRPNTNKQDFNPVNPNLVPRMPFPVSKRVNPNIDYHNADYPGGFYGASWSAVQKLVNKQKKCKGQIMVTIGTVGFIPANTFQVQLSGDEKVFLGLRLANPNVGGATITTVFNLEINNEKIIDGSSVVFYDGGANTRSYPCDYYSVIRPLSGTDRINIAINEAGAGASYPWIFYFL